MRKLKIYLDTSVVNFLFADDAPEFQKITIEFFDKFVKTGIYDVCISDVVVDEITATKNETKRNELMAVIDTYSLDILNVSESQEIKELSNIYLRNKIFSEKSAFDAIHVAVCVINEIDILLSWNFKHLANIERERRITALNVLHNYYTNLRITTPMEVFNNEDL